MHNLHFIPVILKFLVEHVSFKLSIINIIYEQINMILLNNFKTRLSNRNKY